MDDDPSPEQQQRRHDLRGRLTDRDIDILHLLGAVGVATTDQIARGCGFPTRERALRRIALLRALRLVSQSCALGSNTAQLVTLTPFGARTIKETFPLTSAIRVPTRAISLITIAHEVGLGTETYLYIKALTAITDGLCLLAWHEGRHIAGRDTIWTHAGIASDLVAELKQHNEAFRVAVELDTGSESTRQLRAKLTRYEAVIDANTVDEIWLVVPAQARQSSMSELVRGLRVADVTRVLSAEAMRLTPAREPPPRVGSLAIGQ